MGRYLRLEQMARESMNFLVPFFSECYSISIRKPKIRAPVWRKKKDFSGLFMAEDRNGIIQLNKQDCNPERGYRGVVAHEIGHAATYQHHKAYFHSTGDKEKGYIYDALSEGIAMEFEKTGLEAMLESKLINGVEFEVEMVSYRNEVSKGLWAMGFKLMQFMKKRASVREIIYSPEKHFDAIMTEYGKEIESKVSKK